ncbi:MAG: GTP cyclohydrolase FolE2 [Deferribacteraceae bacterium]|jgi:GTP cyclohydrolase I|nr:GTP cyclohydrolase FolE2 [Deferribacteraceae bacterium]
MLKDIQNQKDWRNIDIDRVGIADIVYPVVVKDRSKGKQHTIATISMGVNLPHNFKGTHMSRFVELIHKHRENISIDSIGEILHEMRDSLNAEESQIRLSFKYFAERKAPVSGQISLMDYGCDFFACLSGSGKDLVITVNVPVLSLCPCSKEISDYGAHNQRSIVKISVRASKLVWIEELIEYAEKSASSPIYALLKREDEKFVTERSYENPTFVEDIVRNITELLNSDNRIEWFEVSSTNMESIHNHNAWAVITKDKRQGMK